VELFYQWLENNLDIVFFIYGLAFVVMGIAIFAQPKEESEYRFAGILPLLALFGITHGGNEFLDMWGIIKGRNPAFDLIRWFIVVGSYIFLFEFGRRFLLLARKKISGILGWWLALSVTLIIFIVSFTSSDFWKTGGILARYFLCFPGAFLTGYGFLFYYKDEEKKLKPLGTRRYFQAVAWSFFIYGILGGLVVPKSGLLLSSWLNTDSFREAVKIPVQVFRAICAIAAAFSVVGILKIFNWEKRTRLKDALAIKDKVTEGIEEGLMLLGADLKILWANKKIIDGSGIKIGEILDNYCYKVTHNRDKPCVAPQDICPVNEVKKTGQPVTVLHTHFNKKGDKLYVEVSAYPVKDSEGNIIQFIHLSRDVSEKMKMIEELKTANAKIEEHGRILEDKVEERTKELTESIREADERRRAIINMLEDINQARLDLARVNQELKETQARMLQSEKMAVVGQLASGVAHEINNPLTGILNNLQLVKMSSSVKKDFNIDEFKGLLGIIEESALRCKEITKSLLDFSHTSQERFEPVSLNKLVEKALIFIKYEMKIDNIGIELQLDPELPDVSADAQTLQQALLNIVSNAKWAIGKRSEKDPGLVTIKTRYEKEKNIVWLYVSDTGIGISEENLNKIFEPFFTTKGIGQGTGLGLSVTYGIIQKHKGNIEVESQLNKGTTFKISLPAIVKDK